MYEPAKVLVSISSSGNVVVSNKMLILINFGSGYISEDLELETGNYQLTQFIILNSDNKAIYATPNEGSEFASLVNDPLPIAFSITENGNTLVTPQVVKIEDNTTPEKFGYVSFGFEVVTIPRLKAIRLTEPEYASYLEAEYTYDNGNLTEIRAHWCNQDGSCSPEEELITFEYAPHGKIWKQIETYAGSLQREIENMYDGDKLKRQIVKSYGGQTSWDRKFQYDVNGQLYQIEAFIYNNSNSKYPYGSLSLALVYDNPNYDLRIETSQWSVPNEAYSLKYVEEFVFGGIRNNLPYTYDLNSYLQWHGLYLPKNVTAYKLTTINSAAGQSFECGTSLQFDFATNGFPVKALYLNPDNCSGAFGPSGAEIEYIYETN